MFFRQKTTTTQSWPGSFTSLSKLLMFITHFAIPINAAIAESVCFIKFGSDYILTLGSARPSIDGIFNKLKEICGVEQDRVKADCLGNLGKDLYFGRGTFGGSVCYLNSGDMTPDPCVVQTIKDNCPNGYGTLEDIGATIGIIIGGLALIYCVAKLRKRCRQTNPTAINSDNNPTTVVTSSDGQRDPLLKSTVQSYGTAR